MKRITILTLFPDMFSGFLTNSIVQRAIAKGLVEVKIVNIRGFTLDKYGRVDTPPVGGGAGLIMKCQPILDALKSCRNENSHVMLLSPRGNTFNQKRARELVNNEDDIIIICGHYEGIDERVNHHVDELVSIGDYILTGGEIPAMAISDSIIRLIDGAIASESIVEESFEQDTLEYPQFTEPKDFEGDKIPDILYCGNHQAIDKWRRKQSLDLTRKYRPDLFAKLELSKQDKKLLEELDNNVTEPKWLQDALIKGKKFIK